MPLHDFYCAQCEYRFEELHKDGERVMCPCCSSQTEMLVSPLADYTGQNSRTVQYVNRNAPKHMQDSHLTKLSTDTSFLRKRIGSERVG